MRSIIAITVAIVAIIGTCHAEYFSSMDILTKLRDVEAKLINISRTYIEEQEKEYRRYESFIEHVKLQHSKAAENVEEYVGSPVNAFKLIKRIVVDWKHLHTMVQESPALNTFITNIESLQTEHEVPNAIDLVGAVKGIERLQRFYEINAEEFAEGVIHNVEHGHSLTWHDCYEVAVNLFDIKLFKRSVEWFQLALEKLSAFDAILLQEETIENIQISIFEHLAMAYFELADIDNALKYIDDVLKLQPEYPIQETKMFIKQNAEKKQPPADPPVFSWSANYTRLCQGHAVPDSTKHKLKCYLDSQRHAIFQIAPLKVEQLHLDPDIYVFHRLLTDKQIEKIIAEAGDKLHRSSVISEKSGVVSDVRNSQQTWVSYDSAVMKGVDSLVQKITGLYFEEHNRETMQMANYGIGGQYDCHHDFFGPSYRHDFFHGDRIATTMFYLNDVEQGGNTVFPYLNTFSKPVKGSLVMWHNLHKSVAEDYRTLHCGCPVLKGSKRIGNIWIHSYLQQFNRPCDLFDDKSKSVEYALL